MKILHTSDWHLGRTLYGKKERQEEHSAFLKWLMETIKENSVDLLLIAGDIFDSSSPSSSAQKMYYDFLVKVRTSGCNHVIVTGGNHDSPSFLNAPKDVLAALNITVIGNANENSNDEIIVVKNLDDSPLAIVCGVPFLRERDVSRFTEGETYSDRSKRINENIKKHYAEVAQLAENKRKELGQQLPIIATGHLSVAGGKRNEDDGVREIYIGNIEAVGSDIFPQSFDYVALGHYHIPSVIKNNIRYCGSPIPMGFGEAGQKKCVYIVDFQKEMSISTVEIPVFQKMDSIIGDKTQISERIAYLKKEGNSVWVEIIYKGIDIFPDFSSWCMEQVADSKIEVLKLQNRQYVTELLSIEDSSVALDELNTFDVFDKLLEKNKISEDQKEELQLSYKEIVDQINIER